MTVTIERLRELIDLVETDGGPALIGHEDDAKAALRELLALREAAVNAPPVAPSRTWTLLVQAFERGVTTAEFYELRKLLAEGNTPREAAPPAEVEPIVERLRTIGCQLVDGCENPPTCLGVFQDDDEQRFCYVGCDEHCGHICEGEQTCWPLAASDKGEPSRG